MFQGTDSDTIAAIATPHGESGIGIVRISGPEAKRIAEKIFQPKKRRVVLESHQIRHGEIVDPKKGRAVDEVLLTFMAAPRTYTREDVVEINCHGGYFVLQRVLEVVLREGAREALPGEFTKRAFLNGRIDLAQAESVLDIIRSKTDASLNAAMGQLEGGLSEKIKGVRDELLDLASHVEASIDFPEEDIEILRGCGFEERLKDIDCSSSWSMRVSKMSSV